MATEKLMTLCERAPLPLFADALRFALAVVGEESPLERRADSPLDASVAWPLKGRQA